MNIKRKKKLFQKRLKTWFFTRAAYFVFRVLTATYRVRYVNTELLDEAKKMHPRGSFIFGLWHEFFFAAVATHSHRNIMPMISRSFDGELISYICMKLGFRPVRGSTSRGGEDARKELYREIEKGLIAAFTADGPKGPRRRAKSGLIDLSRKGDMAILPLGISADRCWILHRSWDQSMIPKPFARVYVCYGKPFKIPANCHGNEFALAKKRCTDALNAVAKNASSS